MKLSIYYISIWIILIVISFGCNDIKEQEQSDNLQVGYDQIYKSAKKHKVDSIAEKYFHPIFASGGNLENTFFADFSVEQWDAFFAGHQAVIKSRAEFPEKLRLKKQAKTVGELFSLVKNFPEYASDSLLQVSIQKSAYKKYSIFLDTIGGAIVFFASTRKNISKFKVATILTIIQPNWNLIPFEGH